ncbi:vacuolating cyotoxin family protein [Helicobacter cetorum]|uniref:Vacuolating cytotoxin autotransporter n=1 Tax=Helicobacter cetorum (strain ATCC BAA-540 / CCUG 52418 / MIT 99-5656) TaxID=1163745 RepID=I0ER38_HELCM|nr:vacuolating cyotoxin family protein [Helicobacter cetorum]AFI05407.1 vacuolating cytotoxin [Helicobacter cetorum MIT 99-5656]
MKSQKKHRKMNRPIVSLALVGALVSAKLGANTPNNFQISTTTPPPYLQHAPIHHNNYALLSGIIIPAIISGIASGIAAGTVGGIIGWVTKQAEQANKNPDKPHKIWRIKAGNGFDAFPDKQYDLYQSLLSTDIQSGWDWGNASNHFWVKDGQWNKLEVDMKNARGIYNLSGLINYTGGDLDVDMQRATLRLGQFNGNSFTSFKDDNNRTTRVNFNAKNILIDNFIEINNRVGSGAGRKASSTVLTLQSSEGITSSENAEISLYDGATLNLISSWDRDLKANPWQAVRGVELKGNVWMGRLQYVGAYYAPSWSMIDTSQVKGDVIFHHLTVGDHNAAQAGIIASNKTKIGTLDLWQSAELHVIAPPEGGYKDKDKKHKGSSTQKNQHNTENTAKNDKDNNTQVINPSDSQETEVQPVQVINGTFAGSKDSLVTIDHINVNSDTAVKVGGYKATLITNAENLNIGNINLYNQASGRTLLVENQTGNITVDGTLMVNNQIGSYGFVGSGVNFIFKAGTDTHKGNATFNSNIYLGNSVNLKVDAKTANFRDIDASKGNNSLNATTLDFSGVTENIHINKLTTASTNVAAKNFNIKELDVTTSRGLSVGQYTDFTQDIGDKSHIETVRLETGYSPLYSGGIKFKSGKKLVIDEFYHAPWNYFDARNITDVEITKKLLFAAPGSIVGMTGLMFNNLTLAKGANMDYGKDLDLTIQGNFTNNQGTMNILVQDGRFATLNVGQTATMKFNNMIDSATGFYKPLIKINDAQNLTKNVEHVLVKAQSIDYDNISTNTDINQQEQFKERLALYNNHNRMDICVVRKDSFESDVKACGMAIGNTDMVSHPDNYKYLEGRAWKNTDIGKTATHKEIAVNVKDGHAAPKAHESTEEAKKDKNLISLPTNHNNVKLARFAHYALIRPNATTHSNTTPNLVAINKHNFGTIESVFELANRSDAINVINATSGTQGRDLLQTLLIDSHNAGYARQMIDATSTGEITKQLNVATETLNNIASLEHKTNSLQTLSLSNKMVVNTRLVNLSRKHTNNIDSFAKRLQALQDKRFASVGTMAEVLYQFAPKYEKPANVWANAIGGASLSNGGNTSLYGTSAGMDTYIEGENVEAIVGGFGSYGYSSFNNQASNLNSGANNTNFGLYSRVFANKHEFDFEAQGAVGSNNENLMFKGALLQGLNQGYSYLAYSAMANANYGYDFAFLNNALVFKPSVGVSYNHLGSTNMKSNSNQVALSNGASSRHLLSANANVEARYYYGDTSFFYMNAGILQELANFGFNNAMALNSFKVNATHNPLNTHARVMIGGELQLAKEVYLNLGVIYAHNLNTMIGNIASNLGMRYSF